MKQKKTILALALMLLGQGLTYAKSLVMTLTDGTLVYYQLGGETNPKMRFTDGKIGVDADTYEFSDIQSFYISETDNPSEVTDIRLDRPGASYADGKLTVNLPYANVRVCGVDGMEAEAEVSSDGKTTTVNTGRLAKGVYIISTGKASFKISKR